eukprot:135143_1
MEVNAELTDYRFVVNLINSCISIGILSMPFAFAISKFYSIICIILAFTLITYGAYCITKVALCSYGFNTNETYESIVSDDNDEGDTMNGLQETVDIQKCSVPPIEIGSDQQQSEQEQIHTDSIANQSVYTKISYKALGKVGSVYVTVGMLMCIIFLVNPLVMNWKLLKGIFNIFMTDYNDNLIYLYVIIITLPSVFVINWKSLTIMGWVTVFSITITTMVMVCIFIKAQINFKETNGMIPTSYFDGIDQVNTSQYALDKMDTIAVLFFAFITFVTALGANELIPIMVISAKNKKLGHIMKLICISYGIVAIFYTCLGVIGQQIYGLSTHVLILNNLFYWSLDDVITPLIVSSIMIMNLFASFCIWSAAVSDTIQGILNIKSDETNKRILLNIFLLTVSGLIGFFVRDKLSLLLAVQGCISVIFGADLVVPIALYLGMFWKNINFVTKIFNISLLFLVVGMTIVVAMEAIVELSE